MRQIAFAWRDFFFFVVVTTIIHPSPPEDCQWTPTDNTLLQFAFRLYAGPHSTKFILEDQFNHLQHLSRMHTKGRSHMAKPSQHFYTATSPILPTAHLPGPTVTFATFQQCFQDAGRRKSDVQAKQKQLGLFKPGQHKLPEALGTKKEILGLQRTWKAAGYRSNRVAAAATMMVLTGAENRWQHLSEAWAGPPAKVFRVLVFGPSEGLQSRREHELVTVLL